MLTPNLITVLSYRRSFMRCPVWLYNKLVTIYTGILPLGFTGLIYSLPFSHSQEKRMENWGKHTITRTVHSKPSGSDKNNFGSVVHIVFGTLVNQNLPQKLLRNSSNRLLLFTWLMFALILGTVYRGNLTAALTLPRSPPRPETIEQLIKSVKR